MGNLQAEAKKTVGDHSQEEEEILWKSKVFLHCVHKPGETASYPLLCWQRQLG